MTKRSFLDQAREWALAGARPTDAELAACDERGFGALHALAMAEAESDLPAALFEGLCAEAIGAGASPHAGELEVGHAPLHWCCWHPAPGCASAAIRAGASPASANRMGERPEEIALRLLGPAQSMGPARREKLVRVLGLLTSQRERGALAASCPAADARGLARSL